LNSTKKINLTIIIIGLISIAFISKFWKDDIETNISYNHFLNSDGGGYYNYLPSIFIRQDFGNDTSGKGSTFITKSGHTINKYYVGTALLDIPFFALGCLDTKLHKQEINGYNYYLQRTAALGSLFYFLLGCWFALHWLVLKFKDTNKAILFLLITILSTSIFYYYTYEPFYSHCYSFCFISIFMYSIHQYFNELKFKYLFLSSIAFGFVIIIRPTNALLILLIPFLAGSFEKLKAGAEEAFNHKTNLFLALIVGLLITSIQPFINYWQCGNFFEWAYKREGFIFSNPQIFKVLFSFECGIFVYTPISILAFIGILKLFFKDKFQAISVSAFLIILMFVLSSWWCYTYGDSIVMRPLTDYTTLGAFFIGSFLEKISTKISKIISYLLVTICVLYNFKIFYQYSHGILHFGMMNYEKYCFTFDKFAPKYYGCLGGNKIQGIFSAKEPKIILETFNSYDQNVPYYLTTNAVVEPNNMANKCLYFKDNEFNDGFVLENDSTLFNSNGLYAEIELSRKEVKQNSASDALLVMHLTYPNSKKYFYYTFKINELEQNNYNVWRRWHYTVDIPTPLYPNYKLCFYIWNINKQEFYIDDFSLKVYRLY